MKMMLLAHKQHGRGDLRKGNPYTRTDQGYQAQRMNQRRNLFFEQGKNRLVPEENSGDDEQTAHEHVPLHGFNDKTAKHPVVTFVGPLFP